MTRDPIEKLRPHPPVRSSGKLWGLVHLILALVGWILFVVFWTHVFYRTPPADSAVGVLIVGILLIVSITLTVAWIRHNLVLSERFQGRRLRVPEVREDWSRDKLGRPIDSPDWEALQTASLIDIELNEAGRRKTYRVSSP